MAFRLREIAEIARAQLDGDPQQQIERVRPLHSATAADLSFFTSAKYLDQARASAAGALLVRERLEGFSGAQLLCEDPYRSLARVLTHLYPGPKRRAGVHETAIVGRGAAIDPSAEIGPFVVLGEGARVASGCSIGAHTVVGAHCSIGRESTLHPHVTLYDRTVVGERVVVHSGVVLGADGFGFASGDDLHEKVPQVGNVVIGDDVEIGANSAVDRATLEETRIGRGAKIDNLVQVGHNVEIGDGSILCGQVGVAGSAKVGKGVVLAGQAGVSGHLELGDGVQVAGQSAVFSSVDAGDVVAGTPAIDIRVWRRQMALAARLPQLRSQLRKLERRIDALSRRLGEDDATPDGP